MDFLANTYNKQKSLHHAYILEGEREAVRENLLEFINKDFQYTTQGNPDFFHERYDSFSIDDARALRDMQSTKPMAGDKKVYVIETLAMTVEAQNSLLKVFEEPTAGTHFFIITPTAEIFLPTLRSRVVIVKSAFEKNNVENDEVVFARNFLKAAIPMRLEIVGEIVEEKNKSKAITLVNNLIKILHNKAEPFVMSELLQAREYLSDRSPSLKLLLEHITVIVPIV